MARRIVMNQSALDSPDLGEHFRYPQHDQKVYKFFFETLKIKTSAKNEQKHDKTQ